MYYFDVYFFRKDCSCKNRKDLLITEYSFTLNIKQIKSFKEFFKDGVFIFLIKLHQLSLLWYYPMLLED